MLRRTAALRLFNQSRNYVLPVRQITCLKSTVLVSNALFPNLQLPPYNKIVRCMSSDLKDNKLLALNDLQNIYGAKPKVSHS